MRFVTARCPLCVRGVCTQGLMRLTCAWCWGFGAVGVPT